MKTSDRFNLFIGQFYFFAIVLLSKVRKYPFFKRIYIFLSQKVIKKSELFDVAYYLEKNSDVASSGISPLKHYILHGDSEGRSPMPLFDPAFYRSRENVLRKHPNALVHYVLLGRYLRLATSIWFDTGFYLNCNKDVRKSGVEPLLHFMRWGGVEGRAPSLLFDSGYYLINNPDVAESRVNPLVHYLMFGRYEGREVVSDTQFESDCAPCDQAEFNPLDIIEMDWTHLTAKKDIEIAKVDVIVPVYKGLIETLRCIHSVLTSYNEIDYELIVINDCSPDDELSEKLEELSLQNLFTYLVNQENQGFVGTVNRGMKLHLERDVVLLNSDTEVYGDWLDRLFGVISYEEKISTVTPLSNNATICSYPKTLHDNPYPLEISYSELDKITGEINKGIFADAPSGVGFCMLIARSSLIDLGYFDQDAFGKGYGEENDFCQRAIKKGWKNIITAEVFVRHFGSTSFGNESHKKIEKGLEVVRSRYPTYDQDVQKFIRTDALKTARRNLDWYRLLSVKKEKNILIVCHNRGGGTERHVQEDIQLLIKKGYGIYLLRPAEKLPTHAILAHYKVKFTPNVKVFSLLETGRLVEALQKLNISEVHSHSLVDFIPDSPLYLLEIVKKLKAKWEANIHDYKVVCPRINLADENGYYCGEPDERGCNKCLKERGSVFNVRDIKSWRNMHAEILSEADEILVPDEDVSKRLSNYFPQLSYSVSPHEDLNMNEYKPCLPKVQENEKFRIVVIGAIGKIKGYDVLHACAHYVKKKNLPIQFILMGYSMNDVALKKAGVEVTGKYSEEMAVKRLISLAPHAVWFPYTWPETYSYTLSIAIKANISVIGFNFGAISSRLKQTQYSNYLIDIGLIHQKNEKIVNHFMDLILPENKTA